MTEKRREYLRKLDITKIRPNGRYVDISNNDIFNLTLEDIQELRRIHHNPNIAYAVVLSTKSDSSAKVSPSYKVVREQKYNNGKYRTKKSPLLSFGKRLIIGGVAVCLVLNYAVVRTNENDVSLSSEETVVTEENITNIDIETQYTHLPLETFVPSESKNLDSWEEKNVDSSSVEEMENSRDSLIHHICDIYQVNYDIIYNKLVELTDNFTSEQFLSGYIPGVVCKGEEVVAQNEEGLFVYAIRCMKQLPDSLGVNINGLYIHNDYDSGTDYYAQIDNVASVLGLNRCLLYAIVQSECGFDSELFHSYNNPAGIKNSRGDWWSFSTKEEGFYELGMEVLKYYKWIGKDVSQIDYETLAQIRDIHAPLSDGNENWLPNVVECLQYAQEHEQELFGSTMENNGLSR